MSSKHEKEEETQENFQNVKHLSENKQPEKLKIENSKNSDANDFTKERPAAEPPHDQPSTSGLFRPQKKISEYREQLTMRKDNYAYFVEIKEKPRDIGF